MASVMSDESDIKTSITWLELLVVLLTVLFVALKLTGVIDWGWLWVLSPVLLCMCLPIALIATIIFVIIIVYLAKRFFE